ncbi:hypothetical protein OB2597_03998 [Pseudooceanicola batsensis HTCC2597]|uniref:Glycosyltransferase subfamily 4-like N-terminal domain-containing protein n=1 Tax=Pseudooceanicola batsensis (strain ATCC BAA-863 / DSM 15984 / KCTC 12145 / HTCC2597) TaxID=252305 RepID=A3U2J6_PSEBH|nr:glycosyltransferase [Pseudooceanicola batsensis]EAQ01570.1 hypothetical protein OB2597_03998 [Pseudooceanicola batsensis HTCC2597]
MAVSHAMSIAHTLRVGLVTSTFPVVSESFVYELALALRDHVGALELLPLHGAGPDSVADLGRLAATEALVRMPPPLDRTGAILHGLANPSKLRVDLGAPRRWGGTFRQMRLFENASPYDVVHAQFATLGLDVLRQIDIGALRPRGLVVHVRGYDISKHVRSHGPRVYDSLFARADLFIANCEHFRQVAIGLGCPPDRIVVVGSPCDTDFFTPPATPRPPFEGRPLRLVAVGRLVEKKGFADAVEAVGLLAAQGREVTLDILGDGPERDDLAARAARAGVADRVTFHGAASRPQVLEALHRADIGLAPSVTASTGDQDAPVNTLKEQMATGMPVVATDHGGIPELVIDGVNGRLVPERDPAAIARAIGEFADEPGHWEELGRAGRRKVLENYAPRIILERTLAAYARAVGHDAIPGEES